MIKFKLFFQALAPGAESVQAPSGISEESTGLRQGPPKSGPSTFDDIEVSNIRAIIAKRLGESKVYLFLFIYLIII